MELCLDTTAFTGRQICDNHCVALVLTAVVAASCCAQTFATVSSQTARGTGGVSQGGFAVKVDTRGTVLRRPAIDCDTVPFMQVQLG